MKGIYLSGLDDLKTIGDKLFPDLPTMIIQLIATFILVLILMCDAIILFFRVCILYYVCIIR